MIFGEYLLMAKFARKKGDALKALVEGEAPRLCCSPLCSDTLLYTKRF